MLQRSGIHHLAYVRPYKWWDKLPFPQLLSQISSIKYEGGMLFSDELGWYEEFDRWSPFEFPLYSRNAHAFLSLWFSNYSRRFESMKRRCSPWKNGTDATHASTKRAVSLAKTDEQSSSQKLSQNSELTLPFIQLDWNSSTWPLMVGYIIHRQFPCCSVHKTLQGSWNPEVI